MTFKAVDRRCASSVASNQPACLSLSALKKQAGEHEAGGRAAVLHHQPSLLSSPVTLSTKIKCDEGGGRTRDGHRSRNKRSLRILLRYTHSLPRRLPGCPARSFARYIVTYTPKRRRGTTGRRRSPLAAVVFESTYPSIEGGSRVRQSSCWKSQNL